jgi:hypothetical protein
VSATAREVIERESKYLRDREGEAFFLELDRYTNALLGNTAIRGILGELKAEMDAALRRFVDEENALIDEAKRIRRELAERAPEIDNSDLERPDDPRDPGWMEYELDSLAGFDEVAARIPTPESIGWPSLAGNDINPGPLSRLLGILRGRLRAAEFGEDAPGNAPLIREDLSDLGRRIANLSSEHDHSVRQHQQDALTLPGLAFGRLGYFGTDLNPRPNPIETDDDFIAQFDALLREYGQPKPLVRKFVSGQPLSDYERSTVRHVETSLKDEADRLHQELLRRLPADRPGFLKHPLVVNLASAIVGAIVGAIVAVIVASYFGDGDSSPPTTVTVTRTAP